MLTLDFWVEAKMKVTSEQIILIGRLAGKAMHKNYGTLIFPEISWHWQIITHHFSMLTFVCYKK
jgi:hypothetical protein